VDRNSLLLFPSARRVGFWRDPPFQGKLNLPYSTRLARHMVELRKGLLTIEPRGEEDAASFREWLAVHRDQVFWLRESKHGALVFHALGARAEACREPLNITSRSPVPFKLISNFAHTPFILDGSSYASIEGFGRASNSPMTPIARGLRSFTAAKPRTPAFTRRNPTTSAIAEGG